MFGELQAIVSSDGLHEVILLETFEDADDLVGSAAVGFRSFMSHTFPVFLSTIFGLSEMSILFGIVPPFLSQRSAFLVPPATMTQMLVQFAAVSLVPPDIVLYSINTTQSLRMDLPQH